ncbi:hypothetical protein RBB79_19260 [Tunturiibacter empetritectus]|uniref:Uncharacterized protein n=1 Tax=Tunturiibacter lichenicola TaxID=2051959 RepID=A0A852VJ93_9BACT|nr:hypothetical protein [Edaphobacter lichenicola]NYF91807.1 hypothetical protein [Edaphobacter lichenicola]
MAAVSIFNKRLLNLPHLGAKYSLFYVVPSCYPRSREDEDRTRDSARNGAPSFRSPRHPLDNQANHAASAVAPDEILGPQQLTVCYRGREVTGFAQDPTGVDVALAGS